MRIKPVKAVYSIVSRIAVELEIKVVLKSGEPEDRKCPPITGPTRRSSASAAFSP